MRSMQGRIIAGFVLSVVLLCIATALSMRNVSVLRESAAEIARSQDIIGRLETLQASINDVESGQRGFLMTGSESYLEPYFSGIRSSRSDIAGLTETLAIDPLQGPAISALTHLVEQRIELARNAVENRRAHPDDMPRRLAIAEAGRHAHDQVRAAIADSLHVETSRLSDASERRDTREAGLRLMSLLAAGVSILFVLASMIGILRDLAGRLRAERALADNEARQRQILESLTQLIWTCDRDGQCDYISPQWLRYTGSLEQDNLGDGWIRQIHPDDHARLQDAWHASVDSTLSLDIDYRVRRSDGAYGWFKTRGVALTDASGDVVKWFGSCTDIDDSVRIRDELRNRDCMLRRAEHIAQLGYFIEDPVSGDATLSEGAAEILELPRGTTQLTRQQRASLLHPDDRDRWNAWSLRPGDVPGGNRTVRMQRTDGSLRYIDIHMDFAGGPADIATFGVLQDVTASRLAEQTVRNTEERLRLALKAARMGEWEIDLPSRMLRRSPRHDEIYGLAYAGDAVPMDAFIERIDERDRARVRDSIELAFATAGSWRQELRIIHADGQRRWVWVSGLTFQDASGQSQRMIGTVLDITDRKNAEELVRRHANQQAVVASLGLYALSGQALPYLLKVACRKAAQTLEAAYADITIVEESGSYGDLPRRTGYGWPEGVIETSTVTTPHAHSRHVLERDRPLLIHEGSDGDVLTGDPLLADYDLRSSASVVIRGKLSRHGVISVYADGTPFKRSDTDFLQALANILSAAIERASGENKLAFLAHHDLLTNLPNRKLMTDRLGMAIAHARRNELLLALLFIDLDRFKLVNDSLGHQIGDRLLKEVAERIRSCTRDGDTVSRQGGDEYTVLLPDVQRVENAATVAQHILCQLARPFRIDDRDIYVSASIGIALYPDDASDVHELTRQADAAMYRAKERGRNGYQFFTSEINATMRQRLELENGLRHALQRGEFHLVYQPQLDPLTRQVTAFEALLRWVHPELGVVTPTTFIPIAEDTGLIVPIGEWVLREACLAAGRWQRAGHPDVRIAVNLSARQFFEKDIADRIRTICDEAGFDPTGLEFEITESDIMRDVEAVVEQLRELKQMGASVAIDDFGTGYSSLSYLKRFDVDVLKIDRSFVRDIVIDRDDAAIAASVIALAHSLNMMVVAEGVEDISQRDFLIGCGCDRVQGFFYARPMQESAILGYLATL